MATPAQEIVEAESGKRQGRLPPELSTRVGHPTTRPEMEGALNGSRPTEGWEPRGEVDLKSSPVKNQPCQVHKVCLNPILWGVLFTQHAIKIDGSRTHGGKQRGGVKSPFRGKRRYGHGNNTGVFRCGYGPKVPVSNS